MKGVLVAEGATKVRLIQDDAWWIEITVGRINYSGLVSEVVKEATMAGAMTIATKVRPIRKSCI
jgi:hypothetical protein